ncbi:hypothetical protein ABKV19_013945 [Rosa sericea]
MVPLIQCIPLYNKTALALISLLYFNMLITLFTVRTLIHITCTGKALCEGKQWYFYSRRTQNRVTSNGYWKPLGTEEPVISFTSNNKVGIKRYFGFYVGEAPSGIQTNWTMHEYRLSADSDTYASSSTTRSSKRRGHRKAVNEYSGYVLCRVYERHEDEDDDGTELSCLDEVYLSLDDLDEVSLPN